MIESYGVSRKSLMLLHKIVIAIILLVLFTLGIDNILFTINMTIALIANLIFMRWTKKNMILAEAYDAVRDNNLISMISLIDEGVNLNIRNMENLSLLEVAILLEHKDMINLLIDRVPSLIDINNDNLIKRISRNLNKEKYWMSLLHIILGSQMKRR